MELITTRSILINVMSQVNTTGKVINKEHRSSISQFKYFAKFIEIQTKN